MKSWQLIAIVMAVSLMLNVVALDWGLPAVWEGDPTVPLVLDMASRGTLEPKTFAKPTFQIYLVGAALLPYFGYLKLTGAPLDNESLLFNSPDVLATMYLIARTLTAIFGALTVGIVFLLGKKLAGEKAGFFGALLLAIAPGFVTLSHFSALDVPMVFLSTLSLALIVWSFDAPAMIYAAAFFAGLATATKYPAGLLFAIIAVALFMQKKQFLRRASLSAVTSIVAFIIGMPWVILSPVKFFSQFHQFLAVGGYYGIVGELGFIQHAFNLWYIFGPALALVIIGIAYAIISRDARTRVLLLWTSSFYLIFGFWHNAPLRFILPIVPICAVFAGIAFSRFNKLSRIAAAFVALLTFLATIGALSQFVQDSRSDSHDWILDSVPANSSIYVFGFPGYIPVIPVTREQFETLPHKVPYTGATPGEEPSYEVTYDMLATNYSISEDFRQRTLCKIASSDYIVATEFYYGRFSDTHEFVQGVSSATSYPERTAFFQDLFAGKLGFVVVKEFNHKPIWDSHPPFVNPDIIILRSTGKTQCTDGISTID